MLPILVAVVVSYVVGDAYSSGIFESLLKSKGLYTMPHFKNEAGSSPLMCRPIHARTLARTHACMRAHHIHRSAART